MRRCTGKSFLLWKHGNLRRGVIIDQLNEDKTLLEFISKNLQWGLFHKVLLEGENDVSKSFFDWYSELIATSGRKFKNHELVIYMIVELINSTLL